MKKRILALTLASIVGLTGCSSSGASSSSISSSEASSSSSSSASSSTESPAATFPPFDGFDPARGMSDEEIATATKAAYEGTGDYAADKVPTAIMETSMGTIKMRLFPELAPLAVENFMTHAKNGYYDNVKFHRVIEDFMIQGGDPKGTGTGGQSIWNGPFADEFNAILYNFRGAISMANSGSNTNGSQFFIVQRPELPADEDSWKKLEDVGYQNRLLYEAYSRRDTFVKDRDINEAANDPEVIKAIEGLQTELNATLEKGVTEEYSNQRKTSLEIYKQIGGAPELDNKHTVFGYVYEGMDVVDKIAAAEVGEGDAPKENIIIKKITITEPGSTASSASTSSEAPVSSEEVSSEVVNSTAISVEK